MVSGGVNVGAQVNLAVGLPERQFQRRGHDKKMAVQGTREPSGRRVPGAMREGRAKEMAVALRARPDRATAGAAAGRYVSFRDGRFAVLANAAA